MIGIFLAAVGVFASIAIAIIFVEGLDIDMFPDRHLESKYPILKFSTFLSLYALKEEFGFSKKDMKKYVKWLRNKRAEEKTAKKKAETEAALTWLVSESEKEIAAIRELAAEEHKIAKETCENILRKEQEGVDG